MSDYQSMVVEARRLTANTEEAQWRLSELTHEALSGDDAKSQQEWAADIGLSVGRVSNYLKVWLRYADPASRNPEWTFNDHSEVSRLADEKATAIIAKAERENISIGIARKRISMEGKHRAKFEQEREADLAAALADSGNQVEGVEEARRQHAEDLIDNRTARRAADANPMMQTAAQMLVTLIPDSVRKVRGSIRTANDSGLEITNIQSVVDDLRAALADAEFHAAKRGIILTEVAR